jgi:hypothetical protein
MTPLAVGVPGWPRSSTSWDWWSLVGIVLICLIARRFTGVRLGFPLVVAAIFLGPVVAAAIHRFGVVPVGGAVGIGWVALSLARSARSDRRPPAV